MAARRGFTLVELLVAVAMLALISAAMYGLLNNTQRLSRRQVQRSNLQNAVRAGVLVLPAELREIGYSAAPIGPDLLQVAANRIRFRAMRGLGFTCSFTAAEMRLRKPLLGRYRDPKVGDSLLYFVEKMPNQAADDEWTMLGVTAVDLNSTCPDNQPAIKVTLGLPVGSPYATYANAGSIQAGGPVRFFEIMDMGLYSSGGKSWLGARSISAGEASYQPVLGPLRDGDGLVFTYFNSTNGVVPVTGDLNAIRTIQIDLKGRSDEPVHLGSAGAPQIDTLNLTTTVALRNTLRP